VNDANAIERTLLDNGWESADIIKEENATLAELEEACTKFLDRIHDAKRKTGKAVTALFFFAGHGIQITPQMQAAEAENYLIAYDSKLDKELDATRTCFNLKTLMDNVTKYGADFRIFILDCCRSNPKLQRSLYGATRGDGSPCNVGFSATTCVSGTITTWACAPGETAANGSGQNGVFTEHLVREMNEPNAEILDSLQNTQENVGQAQSSHTGQAPQIQHGSLSKAARRMRWRKGAEKDGEELKEEKRRGKRKEKKAPSPPSHPYSPGSGAGAAGGGGSSSSEADPNNKRPASENGGGDINYRAQKAQKTEQNQEVRRTCAPLSHLPV
jgi:uncharacterized caspase-like protein